MKCSGTKRNKRKVEVGRAQEKLEMDGRIQCLVNEVIIWLDGVDLQIGLNSETRAQLIEGGYLNR